MKLKDLLHIKQPSNWDLFLEWLTKIVKRKHRAERRLNKSGYN